MNKYFKPKNYITFIKTNYIFLVWLKLILSGRLSIKDYNFWKESLRRVDNKINEAPWITIESIKWIDLFINNEKTIFEWGSGGSTLYFSNKVHEIISVEHNKEWWLKIKKLLEEKKKNNYNYFFIEPEENKNQNELEYLSSENNKINYKKYCQKIRDYSDNYFDLVMIEGRARNSCISEAISKIREGGVIVLDNSERLEYKKGIELLVKWKRKDFSGPTLYNFSITQTSIFIKP